MTDAQKRAAEYAKAKEEQKKKNKSYGSKAKEKAQSLWQKKFSKGFRGD